MMYGVASLIAAGDSPHRFRAALRRETHALSAAAASPRAVRAVGYRAPASLLGSELADMMGESLRRALRFWDGEAEGDTPQSRQPSRLMVASTPEASSERLRTIDPSSLWTQGHANPAALLHSDTSRRLEMPWSSSVADPARGNGVASARMVPFSTHQANKRPPVPASPLSSALRAYWAAVESRAPAPNESGSITADERPVVVRRDAGVSNDQRSLRRLTPMDDVSRSAPASDNGRTPFAAFNEPETPSVASLLRRPEPHPEGADRVDWLTGDLSDQLADVLRDQAIRHGVDLT